MSLFVWTVRDAVALAMLAFLIAEALAVALCVGVATLWRRLKGRR